MKKIIIFVLIILLILACAYIGFFKLNKSENVSNSDIPKEENNYFENLVQYKAESVNDEENLYELLTNMEFGKYLAEVKKEFDGEKEYITIYYDCNDAENLRKYFADFNDLAKIEKNTVTLFSLISKLEKVSYNFDISNKELAEEHRIIIPPGLFSQGYYVNTRQQVEKRYNQDVRNYVQNPSEFMNYNIDLNINTVTIYMLDFEEQKESVRTIEITDKTHVNNITEYIKNQNFEQDCVSVNSVCTTWIDLNNGYIIGLTGDSNYGIIIKGNGEEIFADEFVSADEMKDYINKRLPIGLTEYIENIIKQAN